MAPLLSSYRRMIWSLSWAVWYSNYNPTAHSCGVLRTALPSISAHSVVSSVQGAGGGSGEGPQEALHVARVPGEALQPSGAQQREVMSPSTAWGGSRPSQDCTFSEGYFVQFYRHITCTKIWQVHVIFTKTLLQMLLKCKKFKKHFLP